MFHNFKGITYVNTTVQQIPSTGPEADVVVNCSATGKPAPVIRWNTSATLESLSMEPNDWTVLNEDQTFTTMSSLTLRLSPHLGEYVYCLVNQGMRAQRQERIRLPTLFEVEKGTCTAQTMC